MRRHHWKKLLKISKISKFESDLLKKKKNNYSSSKSRNFICGRLHGGGYKLAPDHTTLVSYIFARLRRIAFKFGNFTNFKALFSVVSTDVPKLAHVKGSIQ